VCREFLLVCRQIVQNLHFYAFGACNFTSNHCLDILDVSPILHFQIVCRSPKKFENHWNRACFFVEKK
jgi:hypothetical protein